MCTRLTDLLAVHNIRGVNGGNRLDKGSVDLYKVSKPEYVQYQL